MSADPGGQHEARVGPILYLRGADGDRVRLAALIVRPAGGRPAELVTPLGTVAAERHAVCGNVADRYDFALPADAEAWYEIDGARYPVNAAWSGDLRLAYVSCDGQEHGDLERPGDERNRMWRRLGEEHRSAPFNVLLHGGDQLYADEVLESHPATRRWPKHVPADLDEAAAAELLGSLREAYFRRYLHHYAQPEFAWLAARVPSLMMWDDHDICDGWGSLPPRLLDSAVGRRMFTAARETFLLFQLGAAPDRLPDICLDETGESLTWAVRLPGLHIIAPDSRSERRPDRVMGPRGWAAVEGALAGVTACTVLVLSSTPVLGPRLSIIERLMTVTPWAEKYEDDLIDQWQSRMHREEWRRFLRALMAVHDRDGVGVTMLSGEIHLATRGTIRAATGEMHQLVASGIAHPPPPTLYARILGALAALGEAPVEGHPIRLQPLPGQPRIYSAERNYLVLARTAGRWTAAWELERSGRTPALAI